MDNKPKAHITREVNTFWDLNNAAFVMLEKTKETKDGNYYTIMASLIFSAFCFEAYLNHLGDKKIPFWQEIESIKVFNKYQVLCKEFSVYPDFGRRPWQTLNGLFKFRNALAHGKSQILEVDKHVNPNDDIWDYSPKDVWEEYCTETNATKAREDVEKIITELNIAASEGEFAFYSGMTIASLS